MTTEEQLKKDKGITNEEIVTYYKGRKVKDGDELLMRTAENNFRAGQQRGEELQLIRQRNCQMKAREDVLKIIDDVDIELMLTDVKDKEGRVVELSEPLMEIISIWWQMKKEELKERLKNLFEKDSDLKEKRGSDVCEKCGFYDFEHNFKHYCKKFKPKMEKKR